MADATITVGAYLAQRLKQVGVRHVFGVPGDYVLHLMDRVIDSGIELVGTCNELNAGYAADAYARMNGVGAICVTYGVGAYSALNAVAGAYAEQVPLITLIGGPAITARGRSMQLHHSAGDLRTQLAIFGHVTVAAVLLTDPAEAPAQIDAAIGECLTQKRPVVIEVPTDLVDRPCAAPARFRHALPASAPEALGEALDEIVAMLEGAKRPAMVAGVELHRYGLLDAFGRLVTKSEIPVATTLLGKTVISELDERAVGVYHGALSRPEVLRVVEEADLLLCLGVWMTEMDLGIFTARLDEARLVNANSHRVRVRHHYFEPVELGDLVRGLGERIDASTGARGAYTPAVAALEGDLAVEPERPLTVRHVFARVNRLLTADMVVIPDGGDAIFGAADLVMHDDVRFIAQAFYLSIGYGVPATLGGQLAAPGRRIVTIVGDGSFQMTAQELSTLIRHRLDPIILLLNNDGYTIERLIHEGPYNDIQRWDYQRLPEVFGGGVGLRVATEGEFEQALERAVAHQGGPVLIEVVLDRLDSCDALKRLGALVSKKRRAESEG